MYIIFLISIYMSINVYRLNVNNTRNYVLNFMYTYGLVSELNLLLLLLFTCNCRLLVQGNNKNQMVVFDMRICDYINVILMAVPGDVADRNNDGHGDYFYVTEVMKQIRRSSMLLI